MSILNKLKRAQRKTTWVKYGKRRRIFVPWWNVILRWRLRRAVRKMEKEGMWQAPLEHARGSVDIIVWDEYA